MTDWGGLIPLAKPHWLFIHVLEDLFIDLLCPQLVLLRLLGSFR